LIRIIAEGIAYRVPATFILGELITFFAYGLLGLTGVYIWKIIDDKKIYFRLAFFFILPGCFFMVLYTFVFDLWSTQRWLGFVFTFIGNSLLLLYLLWIAHREIRFVMGLEQAYAQEVKSRRENFIKIRHDFNNQLATIGQLIRNGEDSSSKNMIEALSREIRQTNENPYCNIPVINAILSEKAQACEIAGIGLAVELDIPTKLIVEQMHLCSIFGNLLDNAIAACIQIKDNETVNPDTETARMPTIQLNSTIHGDYLFIKAINPSVEPPKKPPFGRGHGTHILSDITARYDGDYRTEYKDGVFTAVVSLLAVGEG
jgi:signal transduction histidine kinase